MLPLNDFKSVVKNTVLCAIDLVIVNEKQEVLVGLRKNPPGKGYWFVPGGRIFKNETLNEALKRISRNEIGVEIVENNLRLLGLYDHIYEENFFQDLTFNTHYIVIACRVLIDSKCLRLNNLQHEAFKFYKVEELLTSNEVHQFTKNYFISHPSNRFAIDEFR